MKCKDCKHWRKIRDGNAVWDDSIWMGPHGECMRIDEFSTDESAWLSNWLGPIDPEKPVENAASESGLITQPEFGCVLFESNKSQG